MKYDNIYLEIFMINQISFFIYSLLEYPSKYTFE